MDIPAADLPRRHMRPHTQSRRGCFSESPGEDPEVRLVRRDRACRRVSICTERYAEAVHAPDVRLYIA